MNVERRSRWILALCRGTAPRRRAFCFSYAGGGASIFRRLAEHLAEDLELCAVQLPGREDRYAEPAYVSLPALAPVIAAEIRRLLDLPFVFFGHSMGALVAFEVARELRRLSVPQPRQLLLSGRRSPHLPGRRPPLHGRPDDQLDDELRSLGGTAADVLNNPELMELMRPTLRADFELCETYTLTNEAPLDVPFAILGGANDTEVHAEELDAWREHTRAETRVQILPGDHFYLHHQWPAIAREIDHAFAVTTSARHVNPMTPPAAP